MSAILLGLAIVACLGVAAGWVLFARRRWRARRDAIYAAAGALARRLDAATLEVETALWHLGRKAPPGSPRSAAPDGVEAHTARIEVVARFPDPGPRETGAPVRGPGLGSRTVLYETLVTEVERAHHQSRPLTLVLFEVAGCAALESAIGPPALEDIVREIVGRLRDIAGGEGLTCRYAVAGLAVVMPGATRIDGESLLARLGASVARIAPAGLERVTVSAGLAELGRPRCEDALAMLTSAHQALHETHGVELGSTAARE